MYRSQWKAFLKANWPLLVAIATVLVSTALILTWLMDGYVLGLVHGVLATSFISMVLLTFLLTTGATNKLAGAWGEEMTRDELRRAKRKRVIWSSVDSISVGSGDIDHLVITRRRGLVAIDSKWHSSITRQRLEADARSCKEAAKRADLVLRSMKVPVGMIPLVVIWGGVRSEVPEGACIDGVTFIGGHRLLAWLKQLDGEDVDANSADELRTRLVEFRERVRPPLR